MSEFLAAVLIFGGFWFWTFSVLAFFVIMAFAENEKNFWAFLTLGIFIVSMEWAGSTNILNTIVSNPWVIVKWTALYFVAGSVWSIIKWFSYVRNKAIDFGKYKLAYLTECNSIFTAKADANGEKFTLIDVNVKTPIPADAIEHFKSFLRNVGYMKYSTESIIPLATSNKDRLVSWIIWWPTSALWTLINDPIRKLAEKLYGSLQGIYSKISQRAFKDFNV